MTDFKRKAELFNCFFAKQCSIIDNSSELPSNICKKADECISTVTFTSDDIATLIQKHDPNKPHGHDMLSIRMLKLCGKSICKPLNLIFQSCIKDGEFPTEWKKANVVPVHRKSDKQILKNYRQVSLLPICGKIFERLLYNRLYEYFIENELISSNQSGFKPGDSCINQLLSITHDIYQSFDSGFDISKAFEKVLHKGLIYKLKQNGVAGNLLNTLANFLKDRKQRVILNGQNSTWVNVETGVPQCSILGPLPFLIYINESSENLISNPKLFADKRSLFSVIFVKDLSGKNLNDDLNRTNNWAFQWKMSFNPDPNKQAQEVLFSRKIQKSSQPSLIFNNNIVTQSLTQKHLGMFLDTKLDFQEHLKSIFHKVNKTIGLLWKLHHILPRSPLLTIYKSFIRPHLN